MTYNVFGGMLNLAQYNSIQNSLRLETQTPAVVVLVWLVSLVDKVQTVCYIHVYHITHSLCPFIYIDRVAEAIIRL